MRIADWKYSDVTSVLVCVSFYRFVAKQNEKNKEREEKGDKKDN